MLTNTIIRPVLRALAVAGFCSTAACGGASATTAAPVQHATTSAPAPSAAHAQHATGMCPMKVPATDVRVIDTEGGVSIAFVTDGDVGELRRRVRQMAADRGRQHRMMGVPATASVEDIADGARLVLVPEDPDQLIALQQHARRHVAQMSRGECRMMQMHAHGAR